MVADGGAGGSSPPGGRLVILTPLVTSSEHNVVRISRGNAVKEGQLLHVAGGEHTGIIVNKLVDEKPDEGCDVALSFSVWLRTGNAEKQEVRCLRFRFSDDIEDDEKHSIASKFFRDIVAAFPKDYVTFLKQVLKLLQNGYRPLQEVEIDMQFAEDNETSQMPDPKQYDSDSEVENVTIAHVQEVLEHAYPNGLQVEVIAASLRCAVDEVQRFLDELLTAGIARRVQDEWIRVGTVNSLDTSMLMPFLNSRNFTPTVAIITCLFIEKQCVDAIIDDSTTLHRYQSGGDSNIYTIGWIGKHRVVATKLALIGDSREATTSSGSITTRLLGNFQRIEHVFIVGVGGGVAHYTDAARHVRLGDVVASAPNPNCYVFAHAFKVNRVTEKVDGFVVRTWNPQDRILAHIAQNMDSKLNREWDSETRSVMDRLNLANGEVNYSKPPSEMDVLAVPVGSGQMVVVPHPNSDRQTSVVHFGSVGAMVPYRRQSHEEQTSEDTSAATLQLRDKFAAEHNLRAVDAGFDSVIAAITGSRIESWMLIRGISDYQHGQSRVGRAWQGYASVRAASFVRTLILRLPLSEEAE